MNIHEPRGGSRVLLAGTLVSLAVHAALGLGFVRVASRSGPTEVAADDLTRVEIFLPAEPTLPPADEPEPPPPPEVKLGIDDGAPEAEAWLGMSEATEHAARRASVDQSAMTLSASDGAGDSSHAATPGEGAGEGEMPAPAAAEAPNRAPEAEAPTPAELAAAAQRFADSVREAFRFAADAAADAAAELVEPPQPAGAPAMSPPQPAHAGAAPGESAPESPGIPSERESVATSIRSAPAVSPGSVLATQGLEIQTRTPRWTLTTIMLRRPRNPTVEIVFGADGRVQRAAFASDGVRTYSTGFDDVDQPLLSAVYTWTARGKPIDELAARRRAGATRADLPGIRIYLTIILN